MIRKLLVANRGEIALRIFRTCRLSGIQTVAVYAEISDLHVAAADVAVEVDSFLDGAQIIAAAHRAGADAIHPGYGFLSENAAFARDVVTAGLIWIGPDPDAIEAMGDKIRAKKLVAGAGVPILEGGDSFPLLIKAAAGGGGRGMRVVTEPEALESALTAAEAEARSAFGDGTVFTEPYLPLARHVEVQVLGDASGRIWVVGDRDCSVQRRHQKIVEEAPAFGLSGETRAALHRHARNAAEAVRYQGAGTVEFLVDGERIFFLEMNTRLQVEHPVTEAVTGLDLVAWQIAIAEGRELGDAPPAPRGHAIEVRLYAEDPARDFAPQTGRVRAFHFETSDVRVDAGVAAGSEVGIRYDAMLAKIVAHGPDRAAAIRLLADALRRGVIHGLTTNLGLLRAILRDDDFVAGRVDTALLDRRLADWIGGDRDQAVRKAALAAAVGTAVRTAVSGSVQSRIPAAWRNVPSQDRVRTYRCGTAEYAVGYRSRGGRIESSWLPGVTVLAVRGERVVLDDHGVRESYRVTVVEGGADVDGPEGSFDLREVPVFTDPAANLAAGSLLASMPGLVVAVHVEAGQRVAAGDPIVVLEAMKMQQTLSAPAEGVVASLSVAVGRQVAAGDVLAVISHEESR
ncbi:acetyl/propionyl-CoA carboxylase subuit alpha [Actinoplanes ianthinogenes]|uniref:Acetyl/propionyl-CoA carboxylase subuit alpha n=1 Tax=Actinoplanes ianthinogenes TaxID=122358 RepID=A0ABM7LJL6_9ACTN|nr:biotin carboxylase N-terminal domain-containing protein [Actinoplanes ianthinogenes]BCJ39454.1 acetyl/propionyl-CoA carboxylase subuit alpha [Actinoplanes ianthinogenes]GGR35992.1 acetyl/propionyl-CoA carboxylase subuit alpha [Actinoplanes ianthinogenes]